MSEVLVIISILQMRKLRLREVTQFTRFQSGQSDSKATYYYAIETFQAKLCWCEGNIILVSNQGAH